MYSCYEIFWTESGPEDPEIVRCATSYVLAYSKKEARKKAENGEDSGYVPIGLEIDKVLKDDDDEFEEPNPDIKEKLRDDHEYKRLLCEEEFEAYKENLKSREKFNRWLLEKVVYKLDE